MHLNVVTFKGRFYEKVLCLWNIDHHLYMCQKLNKNFQAMNHLHFLD